MVIPEQTTTSQSAVSTSCKDKQTSGVYHIYIQSSAKSPTSVYCDADIDGGSWVVILRRQDGSVDFNRTWDEYKNGFGNADGEFWIGNKFLHDLTKSKPMEMRVDIEEFRGPRVFAKYAVFKVGSEADKYALTVLGYEGNAGDAFSRYIATYNRRYGHSGMMFTTYDQDNDGKKNENCARQFYGGWWFDNCFTALLTGRYARHMRGWLEDEWFFRGGHKILHFVEMKIR